MPSSIQLGCGRQVRDMSSRRHLVKSYAQGGSCFKPDMPLRSHSGSPERCEVFLIPVRSNDDWKDRECLPELPRQRV